jgi:hypothetical protein
MRVSLFVGIPLLVIMCLPFLFSENGLFFPAILFLPGLAKLDSSAKENLFSILSAGLFLFFGLFGELSRRSPQYRRTVKYGPSMMRFVDRHWKWMKWAYLFWLIVFGAGIFAFVYSQPDKNTVWLTAAAIGSVMLWGVTVGLVLYQIAYGRMFYWRSPDLILVRVLADAYTAAAVGKPSDFRSFSYRRIISTHLRKAAELFEGPMLRMLTGSDEAAKAVVRPCLTAAAAKMRQELVPLAMPESGARERLSRALGEALIATATGELARLSPAESIVAAAEGGTWQSRLASFATWGAIALASAAGMWLVWYQVTDAATKLFLLQFGLSCFVVSTFSLLPGGSDRLSGIASIVPTLFGLGKSKG